jgi:hypothetical protein
VIRSMRTLRFVLVTRAGRLVRVGGRHGLRLAHNLSTEALYASIDERLAASVIFRLGLIRRIARRLRRFGPTCLTGAQASEVIDRLVCDRSGVIHHARRS